jgi:hypothetical protein
MTTMTLTETGPHSLTAMARGVWTPAPLPARPATRSHLSLDLPPRLLDGAFGPGRIVRFEDLDFPPALTHEPTRRFLREVGLPEEAGAFALDLDAPLRTPVEYAADEDDRCTALPLCAARLIRLGGLTHGTHALLDGTHGTILRWTDSDGALHLLETDIAAFAFTLWQSTRPALEDVPGIQPV